MLTDSVHAGVGLAGNCQVKLDRNSVGIRGGKDSLDGRHAGEWREDRGSGHTEYERIRYYRDLRSESNRTWTEIDIDGRCLGCPGGSA